jgi:hypothetical protein
MAVISGLINAALFSGSLFAGGTLTIAGLTVPQIITGVVALGGSLASQQQRKAQQRALAAIGDQGFTTTVRGTIVPRRRIYGRRLAGGATVFERVRAPYYVWLGAYAAHRCDAVEEVRINGKAVTLDADGWVISEPYWIGTRSLARVSIRLGDPDQAADPLVLARFPEVGAAFRQRGQTTIALEADWGPDRDTFDRVWGGSFPTLTAILRGARVYDPSDPGQRLDDPATYRWSQSPTLCGADLLTQARFGRVPQDEVDWRALIPSILIDREEVPTQAGPTEPRYTCDGILDTDASTADGLRAILACNRGALVWSATGYRIVAGWRRDPVMTLTAAHLRGGLTLRSETPREEILNEVRVRQADPDFGDQVVEGPWLSDAAAITAQGRPYKGVLDLPMVRGVARGKRLGLAHRRDAQLGRQVRLTADLTALRLDAADTIRIDMPELAGLGLDGLYEVTATGLSPDFRRVELSLSQTSADIYPDMLDEMEPA